MQKKIATTPDSTLTVVKRSFTPNIRRAPRGTSSATAVVLGLLGHRLHGGGGARRAHRRPGRAAAQRAARRRRVGPLVHQCQGHGQGAAGLLGGLLVGADALVGADDLVLVAGD